MNSKEEKSMFNLLAKPINQAFVVAPDKIQEFLNEKPDPKVKERILKNAEKMKLQRLKKEDNNE